MKIGSITNQYAIMLQEPVFQFHRGDPVDIHQHEMRVGVHHHQSLYLLQFTLQSLSLSQIKMHIGQHLRIVLNQILSGFDGQRIHCPRLTYLSQPLYDDGRGCEVS